MKKIAVGIVLFLLLAGCSNSESKTTASSSSEKTDAQKILDDYENGSYEYDESLEPDLISGKNEETIFNDASGKPYYSLKIVKATTNLSETDDFYTNGLPENTVEVTYEYKNYSYPEPMIINSQFINGYDSNGLAGTTQSIMVGQNKVSEGKSAQSTIFIVFPDAVSGMNEIDIEYLDDFSLGFDGVAKFKAELEK